ncbi:MAG: hypothetical protein ACI39W_09295 [Brotaphodocola sp.]
MQVSVGREYVLDFADSKTELRFEMGCGKMVHEDRNDGNMMEVGSI